MKSLVIRAPFNVRSGYNTLCETICASLSKIGYEIYPVSTNGQITSEIVKSFLKPLTAEVMKSTELCIMPIQSDINDYNVLFRMPKVKNRVIFTMWESTQLSMNVVDLLNISNGVIVPNKWNLENFKSDGVTVPIYHCPLFVDTDTFFYKPPAVSDEFVFGTANADVRKRIVDVIRCFSRTFDPSIKNVKLRVKIDREDIHKLPRFSDSRIQICTEKFTSSQLLDWYHSLNLFVSGVSAEGWGFMQHEVMAAGRPILAPKYAGLAEFFDETVGVELKYDLVPAEWSWSHSNGFWTKFDQSDMIKKMRWCVENKSVITNLGIKSEVRAKQFTTDRFVENLNKIITNLQT